MKKKLKALLKWLGFCLLALAVVYASLCLWSAWKLRRACQALAKDGRPMSLAPLIPPRLPDTENAALVYQAAIKLLKSRPVTTGEKSLFDELDGAVTSTILLRNRPHAEVASATETLRKTLRDPAVAKILDEVEAATVKACKYDIDYSQGSEACWPHVDYKHLVPLLCARTRLLAAAGDAVGAWNTALSCLRLADAFKDEPLLGCQFMRLSAANIAFRNLRLLATTSLPTPEQREELERLLKNFDSVQPSIRGVDGERIVAGDWLFSLSPKKTEEVLVGYNVLRSSLRSSCWQSKLMAFAIYASPLAKYDHAIYLDLLRRYANTPGLPDLLQDPSWRREMIPEYCVLSRNIVIDPLLNLKNYQTELLAQVAMVRAGLAIRSYQQVHGVFPKSLAETGITGITDPYSGKPILYKPVGNGFRLYSVGRNHEIERNPDQRIRDDRNLMWEYAP